MKKLLPLILVFFALNVFSQKEANIWYFGENAGLDFNSGAPVPISGGQINTREGCSSFSDSDGNLLFYSDGIIVWNKNHTIMNYTDGNPANNLLGDPSSTQSGMIIPKPGSTTIYYLFTVGDNALPGFNYYTIDISLKGSLGELIDEDGDGSFVNDLATPTGDRNQWTEKVAAVRGTECDTFWVVSFARNNFYSYKVDVTGVISAPVISRVNNTASDRRGYLKLSPSGEKLVIASQGDGNAILYSFNNATGEVANDGVSLVSGGDGSPYGLEFSISSRKLYVSTYNNGNSNKLFQFDLTNASVVSTKTLKMAVVKRATVILLSFITSERLSISTVIS